MRFSDDVYAKANPDFAPHLQNFEKHVQALEARQFDVRWQPGMADPRWQFDNHVDLLRGAYIAKIAVLAQAVVTAAIHENYLIYGLAGRAIIEHAATMRYYVLRIGEKVATYSRKGRVTLDELSEVFNDIDRNLRGGRFDWGAFAEGDVSRVEFQVRPDLQQINVATCIDKWVKDDASVRVLYDLFCDLVHPNIGSTFLVMRLWEGPQLGFSGERAGEAVGWQVFVMSLPGLLPVLSEISRCLEVLQLMRFGDDAG